MTKVKPFIKCVDFWPVEIPPEKLLGGIPFYTRLWFTVAGDPPTSPAVFPGSRTSNCRALAPL